LFPFDVLEPEADAEAELLAEPVAEPVDVAAVFSPETPADDEVVLKLTIEDPDEEVTTLLLVEFETAVTVGVTVVLGTVVTAIEVEVAVSATTVEVLITWPPGRRANANCVGDEMVSLETHDRPPGPNMPTSPGAQQK